MLDEPMGSLDRALRERLPTELRAIFLRLGLTVLYVTHDQEEAFSVADRDGHPARRPHRGGWHAAGAVVPATDRVRGHVPGVPQRGAGDGPRRSRRDALGIVSRARGPGRRGHPRAPAGFAVPRTPTVRSAARDQPAASRATTSWWSVDTDAGGTLELEMRDGPPPERGHPGHRRGRCLQGGRAAGLRIGSALRRLPGPSVGSLPHCTAVGLNLGPGQSRQTHE